MPQSHGDTEKITEYFQIGPFTKMEKHKQAA